MTLGNLDPERLAEIEASAEDAWFISEIRPYITELVAEVRRLQKCAQDVADLLADNVPFGLEVLPHDIMVALRGGPYSEDA